MKILKKILKIISITLLVLLVLLAGLISVPFFFKDKIKAMALEKIDQNINAKVNFGEISFSSYKHFPNFSVTLHDACVTGIQEFEGDTLVFAKEISVAFNIYKFINSHNFEIKGIHLVEPLVHARILPNGKANYNIMKPDTGKAKSDTSSVVNIDIDEWSIRNGRVIYDDKLQRTYIEVGGLHHSGSGDFKQEVSDLNITTRVSDLTLVYNGVRYFNKKLFKADLVMEMNLKEKKFIFRDHTFQLGHFKFGFDGYFKLLENGYETNLNFVVKETSFKSLLSLLPGIYQKDLEDMKTKGEFSCKGFMKGVYDAKNNKVPAFHLDLQVKDAMFKYAALPKAVENIDFHLVADNPDGNAEHSSYDLKVFHFEIDHEPVHGSISIKGLKDLHLNADIKLSADLAQIEKIYPIDSLVLRGKLNSEIKISGRYNAEKKLFPKVDAFLALEKGYVKYGLSPLEMDSIHLNAELLNATGQLADTHVNLNNMTFLLDGEPFVMTGTVSDLKDYNYDFKVDGLVDLGKLTQLYPLPGTTLQGTMDFDIKTKGNLADLEAENLAKLKTKGTLEMKDVSLKSEGLADPVHIDDALFTFTPHKIVLNRFQAEFGKSNITLSGHLFNYIPFILKHDAPIRGDLTMTCDTLDLNDWFPKSIASDTAKSVSPPEVLVLPANIQFTIDSDIKKVKFGDMDISNLDGEVKIQNGVLTLNETGFNTLDSRFTLSGDYNSTDTKHPMFDMKIDIEKLDINRAYQTFIDDKEKAPAEGDFSTSYTLRGELTPDFMPINSTLAGKGKITIEKVSVKGMKLFNHVKGVSKKEEFNNPELEDIVMDTEIRNGKFLIYPFSFKVSKFLTEVEGESGFDDSLNYLIKISIPPFTKLRIPISITGTSNKPVIRLGKGFNAADFEKLN